MDRRVIYAPDNVTTTTPVHLVTNDRGNVVELRVAAGGAFAAYAYDPWGLPLGAPAGRRVVAALIGVAVLFTLIWVVWLLLMLPELS